MVFTEDNKGLPGRSSGGCWQAKDWFMFCETEGLALVALSKEKVT